MNAAAYRPVIERSIYRTLCAFGTKHSRQDIEDLAQETLLALWQRGFDLPEEERQPYVARAARNVALDALRTQRAKKRAAQATWSLDENLQIPARRPPPDQVVLAREQLHSVLHLLRERLQPRSFKAACLRFLQGLSAREAARVLDVSPAAVHTAVYRARKAITATAHRP